MWLQRAKLKWKPVGEAHADERIKLSSEGGLHLWRDPEAQRSNGVQAAQHSALHVIALTILDERVDQEDGGDEDDGFERLKVERQRLLDRPTDKDEDRNHADADLDGRTDGDTETDLHLALAGHPHSSQVFGHVADDGQQNGADEGLGDFVVVGDFVNCSDKVVGIEGGEHGHATQRDHGGDRRHVGLLLLVVLLVGFVEERMRLELEVQIQDVDAHQNQRSASRDEQQSRTILLADDGRIEQSEFFEVARQSSARFDRHVVRCRNCECDATERHDRSASLGRRLLERVFAPKQPTGDKAHAQHQQDVAQDRADQTGLHDPQLTLDQRNDTDDQLDSVAKRSVEQTAQRLSQAQRDLFGRIAQNLGERDDGEEVERKDPDRRPVQVLGHDTERHKHQERIDPRTRQDPVERADDVGLLRMRAAVLIVVARQSVVVCADQRCTFVGRHLVLRCSMLDA